MKSWKAKFFTIWTGQAFSLFGSSLVDFALIWWLTETTGSQRVLTISSLLTLLPRMLLGPFAGTLIDRVNRKRVMILADGAIAFLTLGLLFAYHRNAMTVFLVMGALLLRSLGSMFHQPAMKSATALLVPASQLARIGGLNRILSGAMSIVAPVAGAMVIELFDIGAVLCIDVVTAAVAVATLAAASVPDASERGEQKKHTLFKETADGVRYVWNTKSVLFVVGTCALANFCIGPAESLKSLMITTVFHGGALELSWVTAATGLGMIVGGVVMGIWGGCRRHLKTSAIGWGGVGIAYGMVAFLKPEGFLLLILCMFVSGIFLAIGNAGLDAFYQTKIPKEYHGRVYSVLMTLDNMTVPLGLAVATVFSGLLPIRFWYLATGLLHFCLFLFWSASRELKRAEERETGV